VKKTKKIIRKGRKLRISMSLGEFNEKKFRGYNLSSCTKKTKSITIAQKKIKENGYVYLKVYYDDRFNYNHGTYKTLKDFKIALDNFTENQLLDYIERTRS